MLKGITIRQLKKTADERGFFAEVMRADWHDTFGNENPVQANLSFTYPGVVRAWHKHERGQVDNFVVLRGLVKICAYDEKTKELDEITSTAETLQLVHLPGVYWHGFKTLGNEPALVLYFVNNLYLYEEPDERRRPWNDPSIVPLSINGRSEDPRVNTSWDWFYPPHK